MATIKDNSNQELLWMLKAGDKKAFTEIYARYAKLLLKFTSHRLNNLSDAEDIIHDIFLQLWQSRESNSITNNLESYLFTVTRNKITDLYRKKLRQDEYLNTISSFSDNYSLSVEQLYQGKELQDIINIHIAELSPRTKEIYELSRNEHQSISEISVKLKLSEQTIKNQLTIALKYLKSKLPTSVVIIGFLLHIQ